MSHFRPRSSWHIDRLLAAFAACLLATAPATRAEETDTPAEPLVQIVGERPDAPLRAVPLELDAGEALGLERMRGRGWLVEPKAVSDGWVSTYHLNTDWGRIEIAGTEATLYRFNEINALHELEALKRTSVVGDAIKDGALAPVRGAGKVVTAPVQTTTGAVKGLGRWIGNVGRSAVSQDPDQEGMVSAVVGYAGARRAYALAFGVDPWTEFEPVQDRLGELARAAVGAGLAMTLVMSMVTPENEFGMAITALGLTNDRNEMLADEPAGRIRSINKDKLVEMKVPKSQAEALMRNYNYTPLQHSLLVAALEQMGDVEGREILVAYAASAADEDVANYARLQAQMMANYMAQVGKADIVDVAANPWLRTKAGRIIGLFPADAVFWTAELDAADVETTAAMADLAGVTGRSLWFEGSVDPDARKMLRRRGWMVHDRVGLTPRGLAERKGDSES